MRVDLEHIEYLRSERHKINSVELETIEFYENGEQIDIDPRNVRDFWYCGLNNIDFISSGYYLREMD